MAYKEVLKLTKKQRLIRKGEIIGCIHVSEVSH